MVDIAEIGIGVDTSHVKAAKTELQAIDAAFNTAERSASVFVQAFNRATARAVKDAEIIRKSSRAFQELVNTANNVTNSYKSAEASAEAFTMELRKQELQALKTAQANQAAINKQLNVNAPSAVSGGAGFGALDAEIERLSQQYNKIYASSRLYESSLSELNRAHQLGIISVKQHEAAVESLNLEYQTFQAGAVTGMNRFANAAQQTAGRANQLGVVVQQTGYQVGDFLVQVQSGQNWMVAFGQQATQLVGTLPLLSTTLGMSVSSLIAWSTGLGIAIPLMTAVGAYFMRTGENAASASKNIDTYAEAIKAASEEVKGLNSDLLEMRFPNLTDAQGLLKIQLEEATVKAEDLRAKIQEVSEGLNFQQKGQVLQNLSADLNAAVDKANELEKSYKEITDRQQQLANGAAEAARFEEKRRQTAEAILSQLRAEKAERERMLGVTAQANVLYAKSRLEGQALAEAAKYTGIEMARAASIKFGNLAEALAYLNGMASAALSTANYLAVIGKTSSGSGPDAARSGAVYLEGEQLVSQPTGAGLAIPKGAGGGSSGGGGGSSVEDQLEKELDAIRQSSAAKAELEIEEYEKRQQTLKSALDSKLLTLQEYNSLELQISKDHAAALTEIDVYRYGSALDKAGKWFGDMASATQSGGEKLLRISKVFGAAEALINSYKAFTDVIADKSLPWYAKVPAALGVLGAGLGMVNAIKGVGAGSSGSSGAGGGGRGSASVSPAAAPQTPQRVVVQGINPDDIFTGQWLSNFFDNFYKENNDRGAVFMVNR